MALLLSYELSAGIKFSSGVCNHDSLVEYNGECNMCSPLTNNHLKHCLKWSIMHTNCLKTFRNFLKQRTVYCHFNDVIYLLNFLFIFHIHILYSYTIIIYRASIQLNKRNNRADQS